MSTVFQRTFGHLVAANAVLNGDPPPPPLHPAPSINPPTSSQRSLPPPTDTSLRIILGRTLTSKSLLNAGFRYSRDGKPLTDGRQAWRCVKRAPLTLADLHLEPKDCRTLRQADMLLYDNASDHRRVIILATSDNLNILAESSSWYLDGTFKSSHNLFYQILIILPHR
ncbi:hypothetical protein ACHWQZ_G010059 [Mnemiopsis leidyi]